MEKQYSTHYLPQKYKQQFIDIYNFEIYNSFKYTVHHAATKIVG